MPKVIDGKLQHVLGFVFDEKAQHVLLIKKNKPAFQVGKLNGIGGKIEEEDGSSAHAMQREMIEETGITVPSDNWYAMGTMQGNSWAADVFYTTINKVVDTIVQTTDEHVSWYPISPLPTTVIHNLTWLIPMAISKLTLGDSTLFTSIHQEE
jgi:8-oxo-dGTP diphosphatase